MLKEESKPGLHLKCIIKCYNFKKKQKHEMKVYVEMLVFILYMCVTGARVCKFELHGEVRIEIIKLCENSEVVIQTLDYIFHRRKILKDK